MAKGFKIHDKDKGFKKYIQTMSKIAKEKSHVAIGILGSSALDLHKNASVTIVDIATFHEFGGSNNKPPMRSFLRLTIDRDKSKIRSILKAQYELVAKMISGIEKALSTVGMVVQNMVKATFTNNDWQPLSSKTIAAKGSSQPLIDTGQLRNSIVYEVRSAGK